MSTKDTTGVESSGTTTEASPAEHDSDGLTDAEAAQIDPHLSEILELMEAADWRDVPHFSVAEAAALAARLAEAREAARAIAYEDGGA